MRTGRSAESWAKGLQGKSSCRAGPEVLADLLMLVSARYEADEQAAKPRAERK